MLFGEIPNPKNMKMLLDKFKPLISIGLPNYLREVKISNAQNPKYFEWDGNTIRAKNKKLWKKCINTNAVNTVITPNDLKSNYKIIGFKGKYIYSIINTTDQIQIFNLTEKQNKVKVKYILCIEDVEGDIKLDKTYSKVIANPSQVGKENKIIVTGQKGYYGIHTQNLIVSKLKESYYKKFDKIPSDHKIKLANILNSNFPIWMILEIQDTVKAFNDTTKEGYGRAWDVDNRALPYLKTFKDFLVHGYSKENGEYLQVPILQDDDRLKVMGDASIFTPIDEFAERKLIFHFYKDERKIWKNYE